jgi:hypothetical protein
VTIFEHEDVQELVVVLNEANNALLDNVVFDIRFKHQVGVPEVQFVLLHLRKINYYRV